MQALKDRFSALDGKITSNSFAFKGHKILVADAMQALEDRLESAEENVACLSSHVASLKQDLCNISNGRDPNMNATIEQQINSWFITPTVDAKIQYIVQQKFQDREHVALDAFSKITQAHTEAL